MTDHDVNVLFSKLNVKQIQQVFIMSDDEESDDENYDEQMLHCYGCGGNGLEMENIYYALCSTCEEVERQAHIKGNRISGQLIRRQRERVQKREVKT
jgi:hypothetical protein